MPISYSRFVGGWLVWWRSRSDNVDSRSMSLDIKVPFGNHSKSEQQVFHLIKALQMVVHSLITQSTVLKMATSIKSVRGYN